MCEWRTLNVEHPSDENMTEEQDGESRALRVLWPRWRVPGPQGRALKATPGSMHRGVGLGFSEAPRRATRAEAPPVQGHSK